MKVNQFYSLFLFALLFLTSISSKAQQWVGTNPGPLYYTGGNVGIGVTNPSAILEVSGDINISGTSPFFKMGGQRVFEGVMNTPTTGEHRLDIGEGFGTLLFKSVDNAQFNSDRVIFTGSKTIFDGGSVGIGTDAPTEKLVVRNGNIRILRTNGANAQLQLTDSGTRNWYNRVVVGSDRFAIADDAQEFYIHFRRKW